MGKSSNMCVLSEGDEPPSSTPGPVTVESRGSDTSCNRERIARGQGRDEEGLYSPLGSHLLEDPTSLCRGRARGQVFPAPAEARGRPWENQGSATAPFQSG